MATPKGSATAVGDAIDEVRGTPLGTAEPFIISLGSVENQLYGVELDTDSLIHFNPEPGLLLGIITASLLGIWIKRNAKE